MLVYKKIANTQTATLLENTTMQALYNITYRGGQSTRPQYLSKSRDTPGQIYSTTVKSSDKMLLRVKRSLLVFKSTCLAKYLKYK